MQKIGFHIQWLGYLPLIASNPVLFNIVDEVIIKFKWTARFRAMNFKRSVELQKRLGLSKRFSRLHTVLKTVRTPGTVNLIFFKKKDTSTNDKKRIQLTLVQRFVFVVILVVRVHPLPLVHNRRQCLV